MSEITLDDLWVRHGHGHSVRERDGCDLEAVRRLTPAEFDRIARERGYWRPTDTSQGAFRAVAPNGEVWEVPELVLRVQGYVKVEDIALEAWKDAWRAVLDAQTIQRLRWLSDGRAKEIQIGDSVLIAEILDALDGGQE